MTNHIYALVEPGDRIFYIGKTIMPRKRLSHHISDAIKGLGGRRNKRIRKLLAAGIRPGMIILEECEGDGCAEERYHIALARRDGIQLTNETDGGDGIPGLKRSEEVRRKMGEISRRNWQNPETRAKMIAHMRAFRHSPESREKMSAAQKGKRRSDAFKAALSRAMKGRKRTSEAVEQGAAKIRGRKLPEWHVHLLVEASRSRKRTPEENERRAAKLRGQKRSPEFARRIAETRRGQKHSPDSIALMSENRKGKGLGVRQSAEWVAKKNEAHVRHGGDPDERRRAIAEVELLRNTHRLQWGDIAAASGLHLNAIYNMRKGIRLPKMETIRRILAAVEAMIHTTTHVDVIAPVERQVTSLPEFAAATSDIPSLKIFTEP